MLKLNYGQFTGVIQVMKVVSNQMVLTFCENLPGKQFFTIILSRQPNIFSAEVRLFHPFSTRIYYEKTPFELLIFIIFF